MCWKEDSTVLTVAVAWCRIRLSSKRAGAGDTDVSLSGGAFLRFHAKAMTDQTTSASVCDRSEQGSWVCSSCSHASVIGSGRYSLMALSALIGFQVLHYQWGLQ